jgi:hypothetical protein
MRRAAALGLVIVAASGVVAGAQPAAGFDVRIPDKLELVAGESGTLGVAIAIDRGLQISRDAALILDLAPDPGVAIKKRRLGRGDAVDPEAESPRFAIPVRADATGQTNVAVRVRFWLCAARACRPVDVRRTVPVVVSGGSGA